MSYYFISFDQFGYESNLLVQGSCRCELPKLIHTINDQRIDTFAICEMHNHADKYHKKDLPAAIRNARISAAPF
jgi:hypothetical protein